MKTPQIGRHETIVQMQKPNNRTKIATNIETKIQVNYETKFKEDAAVFVLKVNKLKIDFIS